MPRRPKKPRGYCAACGRLCTIRADGAVAAHWLAGAGRAHTGPRCPGRGRRPTDFAPANPARAALEELEHGVVQGRRPPELLALCARLAQYL